MTYSNSKGQLVVQPILVELLGMNKNDVELIYISDSKSECNSTVSGSYKGNVYEYNAPNKTDETKFLLYTGLEVGEEKYFTEKLICARYRNETNDSAVGHVYKKNFVDFDHGNFDKVLGLDGTRHDSMYNYEIKNRSVFKAWIEKFKSSTNEEKSIIKDTDADDLFDKYFEIIHFRTFDQMNLVTLWITNKEEIQVFPVYKLTLESPTKIRMAVISEKIYWYVLMIDKRLIVKYDCTEIKNKYTLDEVTKYNIHILHNPADFELLQNGDKLRIVVIDSYVSCILLLDESLVTVKSLCKGNKDAKIVNPISLSCIISVDQSNVFNCFVIENITDEIVWVTVNIDNDELKYISRYTTGTQVHDLDPLLGSIVSIESLNYSDTNQSSILLFIIRVSPYLSANHF